MTPDNRLLPDHSDMTKISTPSGHGEKVDILGVSEHAVQCMIAVLYECVSVEGCEDHLNPIHPDDWRRMAQTLIDVDRQQQRGVVSTDAASARDAGSVPGQFSGAADENQQEDR